MAKSADAFRTISEVADWLDIQPHVLRFWESKFTQIKPTKRAGGRRYYRPKDMLFIGGLKKLLHEDGLTIKGAQKLAREKGIGYISSLSPPLEEGLSGEDVDATDTSSQVEAVPSDSAAARPSSHDTAHHQVQDEPTDIPLMAPSDRADTQNVVTLDGGPLKRNPAKPKPRPADANQFDLFGNTDAGDPDTWDDTIDNFWSPPRIEATYPSLLSAVSDPDHVRQKLGAQGPDFLAVLRGILAQRT